MGQTVSLTVTSLSELLAQRQTRAAQSDEIA
jgi:hypothetical protein